jgi:hypothetical protein
MGMAELDHIILTVRDVGERAASYTGVMGFGNEGSDGPFTVLRVNERLVIFALMAWLGLFGSVAPARADRESSPPRVGGVIDSCAVDSAGLLHVVLTDGRDVAVPRERGRFTSDGDTLTQEGFHSIQIDEHHRRVGWLASYMICAQSYPCTPELAIFDEAQGTTYIDPPAGIIWEWAFVGGGKRVVIHYGFPHGDEVGAYALYDAETGVKEADYTPGQKGTRPDWARELSSPDR